ncbi:hypothetical protein, partial [Enterococcus durans]|uniref:hypothetical protein n=1 Tax=Enterococcus durans TaxID=53345 RepID=UPI001D0E39C5
VSIIGIAFDPNQRIALIIGIPFTILCFFYYQLFFSKKASVAIEIKKWVSFPMNFKEWQKNQK